VRRALFARRFSFFGLSAVSSQSVARKQRSPLFLFRAISGIQSKRGAQTTLAAFPFSGYQP